MEPFVFVLKIFQVFGTTGVRRASENLIANPGIPTFCTKRMIFLLCFINAAAP